MPLPTGKYFSTHFEDDEGPRAHSGNSDIGGFNSSRPDSTAQQRA